ncbi:intermembrane transport protein PqiB [Methylogaea oryzae]|uniref:PqiB family protein n=1 Tax=Methylogaea oryzae TaxID=1295382 RepID=UPI0020CFFFCE|nr:MlaD family protein [Methylogaea oryzae]
MDIGEVTEVGISDDRSHIIVTAQFHKDAEKFLMKDTRFWVVRPRVTGGQVSGVSTLLSGAYIGVDVGKSDEPRREFTGLEVAPILTGDLPGRKITLQAGNLGSLDIGSPVYYRHIKAGEVIAHELDKNGTDVHVVVFVHAPYDRFITRATRFWNDSGVDVSLDASGMHVHTQSVVSVLLGGIAFETLPDAGESPAPSDDAQFVLYPDHAAAMKPPDGEPQRFVLHFPESLRGLTVGAPVDFRGIVVGEVVSINVEYQKQGQWFHFPVEIAIYPERMRAHLGEGKLAETEKGGGNELLDAMVSRGFRAQLRSGNLLTGQLYVALDFFPDVPPFKINWARKPLQLPAVPGSIEELQMSLAKLLKKVDKVPLEQIGGNVNAALGTLNRTVASMDQLLQRLDKETAPEARATLEELRRTLKADSPLQQELRDTLNETARAARALRSLTDTLDTQPEALIRGKED